MANNENQVTASIAAVGSQAQGINEINPRFTAEAQRNIRGFDCGVLDNTFYDAGRDALGIDRAANDNFMFPLTVTGTSISIGRGMATAYGYDFQSEVTNTLPVTDTDAGITRPGDTGSTIYYFVYLEWNLGDNPPRGYIKVHNNGSAGIWNTMQQDNLITTTAGVYQMPLYRIAMTASGDPQVRDWEDLNLTQTIHWPGVAETARYGETMAEGDQSDRVATTKFVQNAADANRKLVQDLIDDINTSLNFGNTTFTLAGVGAPIKRLGGYVIGAFYASEEALKVWTAVSANTVISEAIPTGYRPTETHYGIIRRKEYDVYRSAVYSSSNDTWTYTEMSRSEVWRDLVRIQIDSTGDVTALDAIPTGDELISNEMISTTVYYQHVYEPSDTCQLDLGYTTNDKLTITVTAWNGYPVTTNITGNVYYQGPDYMEPGKTYTFTAKALSYGHKMKTCSLNAVGYGQVATNNNGDGTWTVTTPTSSLFKGEYIITMEEDWIDTPDVEERRDPLPDPVIPDSQYFWDNVVIEGANLTHTRNNIPEQIGEGTTNTVNIEAYTGWKIESVTIKQTALVMSGAMGTLTNTPEITQDGNAYTFTTEELNSRYSIENSDRTITFTITCVADE